MPGTETLLSLKPGESGYILGFSEMESSIRRRLMDMGLTYGVCVTVIGAAPFGDPIRITLRNYSLSIRRRDAKYIRILKSSESASTDDGIKAKNRDIYRTIEGLLKTFKASEKTAEDTSAQTALGDKRSLKIALLGNPNSGKTTLFNALTGSREYVGNWPGVTVEKKEGRLYDPENPQNKATLVDLPGIYSLSPHSMEQMIARKFIFEEKPDIIINIVDATNIERNLYLTTQAAELGIPLILAVNMMDESLRSGDTWDFDALSRAISAPAIPISARHGDGIDKLLHAVFHYEHIDNNADKKAAEYDYIKLQNAAYDAFYDTLKPYADKAGIPLRFAAMKILEGDTDVIRAMDLPDDVFDSINKSFMGDTACDFEEYVADARYNFITAALSNAYKRGQSEIHTTSAKIDRIVTNKYLALPIFIAIMLIIFALTFSTVGSFLSDTVSHTLDEIISPWVNKTLSNINTADWLIGLICDGIISGVGGVLSFLPQIAILFFLLSLLEDSGYMARIAFMMDAPMRKIGLSGKSIIPLLMGFGCTVPAAMSTRTMDTMTDKRMTILLLPFMSCSAKLPVYGLIAGAFFARGRLAVILALYLIGIILAVIAGLIFKKTVFRDANAPFMIELPHYRMPTTKNTLMHVWERVSHFLKKAGTLILVMSVVLWFLLHFDFAFNMTAESAKSILGTVGRCIAPIFTPNGFPFWQAAVALLAGVVAKESVVAALAMFYGFAQDAGSSGVYAAMATDFTPAAAFSFLVFVLLYTPCVAAISTMHKELMSKRYTALAVAIQMGAAYVVSVFAYTVCSMLF